jgi:hypothetical protein
MTISQYTELSARSTQGYPPDDVHEVVRTNLSENLKLKIQISKQITVCFT